MPQLYNSKHVVYYRHKIEEIIEFAEGNLTKAKMIQLCEDLQQYLDERNPDNADKIVREPGDYR